MIEAVPLFRKSGALANNIRKPALNAWGQPTSRRLEVPRVADISNPVPGGSLPPRRSEGGHLRSRGQSRRGGESRNGGSPGGEVSISNGGKQDANDVHHDHVGQSNSHLR